MSNEIRRLKAELAERSSSTTPADSATDTAEFKELRDASKKSRIEKSVIVSELAKRQREAKMALKEKQEFAARIEELEKEIVGGSVSLY